MDQIVCDFIKLAPLVFDVSDAIERSLQFKNSNKKTTFNFTYPGFGKVPMTQNMIKYLYERALCSTPKSIFTEICYLILDTTSSHKTRILQDIFIYLYLIRRKFYELQRSLSISRLYINTCKRHFYYFKLNIPSNNKPSQTTKRYNNHQLVVLQELSYCKQRVDPFAFGECTEADLNNLTQKDYDNLQKYIYNLTNDYIEEDICEEYS
jgi:hypothetical protein